MRLGGYECILKPNEYFMKHLRDNGRWEMDGSFPLRNKNSILDGSESIDWLKCPLPKARWVREGGKDSTGLLNL